MSSELVEFAGAFDEAGTGFFGYDSGPAHSTALLLLHGNGGTSGAFTATGLFQRLARQFRVVAFDARGFGATPPVEGPLSYLNMADDAAEILTALGIQECIAVGLSMGAEPHKRWQYATRADRRCGLRRHRTSRHLL